jgi:hypothetical protein
MSFPIFSTFRGWGASWAVSAAFLAVLGGCASKPPTTIAYIRAGQFVLHPESVKLAQDNDEQITAKITVNQEEREIVVLAPECRDGVGNILVPEEVSKLETAEVLAFARSDQAADKLFEAVCKIGLSRIDSKRHGG